MSCPTGTVDKVWRKSLTDSVDGMGGALTLRKCNIHSEAEGESAQETDQLPGAGGKQGFSETKGRVFQGERGQPRYRLLRSK